MKLPKRGSRYYVAAFAGLTVAAPTIVMSGCGGSDPVVTVTKTRTVVASAPAPVAVPSLATDSDRAWASLIREQARAVDDISLSIRTEGFNPDNFSKVDRLEARLERQGIAGTSPCMQEVIADWAGVQARFVEAFSLRNGAIPEMAAAAAKVFQSGDAPPFRPEANTVLTSLNGCLATLGSTASAASTGAPSSTQLTDAIDSWISSPPQGAEGPRTPDELRQFLQYQGKLRPGGYTVQCTDSRSGVEVVSIEGNERVPSSGDVNAPLEPFTLTLALTPDGSNYSVVAASGGNFYWSVGGVPSGAQASSLGNGC